MLRKRWAAVRRLLSLLLLVPPSASTRGQEAARQPLPPDVDSVAVDDSGAVELHVADLPLATVLRMLSVHAQRNIIATPAVQGTVTADLYNVSFEHALKAVLTANNCDYQVRDGFVYVYTLEELAAMRSSEAPMSSRVYRLSYVRASDVEAVVKPLLSEKGSITHSPDAKVGIESKSEDAGGDAFAVNDLILVTDFPDRLLEVGKVLKQIDVRPQQVLVEATILRARLTDDNSLGIDFTLVGGVDLEVLGATSNGIQNLVTGTLPTDRLERFNANATTSFTNNVPDGGLTFGIIKDHVAVFLRALEQINDTSVLANPKLLVLNKQVGTVIVGRRDGYITTTVTETQAVQKVEFLETGTQLTFRPFIGHDGYVRLEIHPEDSVGGLTAAQLPFEQTTEVTTNIIVRDGYTVLIGGLFREVSTDSRAQLPLLGDVPAVGDLFRSRTDNLDREEVIILLTVHVIENEDVYTEYSQRQRSDLESTRVGLRQGMMWHGRERLAQHYYRHALDHFTKGDDEKALWNVQMALHNYPRFVSAIELKEQIEQTRAWEDDASLTRNFLAEMLMQEKGIQGTPFDRPAPPFRREPLEPPVQDTEPK